jgi:pyruvate ferredoxin oxidoreductase beta subunit
MASLKELSKKKAGLIGGHRLCSGCGIPLIVKQVLLGTDDPVVVCTATGCLEVATTIYPYTSWRMPWIHSAFENAGATISGVEAMYQSLKKQGKINRKIKFLAFGGDGGTYDIGLQSLSGALERGHDFLYVCYDNGAYMNTGVQRSSSTPYGAASSTTPVGKVLHGKSQFQKDLTAIVAAHNIPYAAQASAAYWADMTKKTKKAFDTEGPTFINTISNCNLGWKNKPQDTVKILKMAVDTCYWPLFEVENGEWRLTYRPKEKVPIIEWFKLQGRFKHLLKPENKELVDAFQAEVDRRWERLLKRCGESA